MGLRPVKQNGGEFEGQGFRVLGKPWQNLESILRFTGEDATMTHNRSRQGCQGVALAVLHREGKFLMQLRDDVPHINHPGKWGLFGGHLEPGESPAIAMERELQEEIGIDQLWLKPLGTLHLPPATRHLFHGPLPVTLESLTLGEGWDFALLSPAELATGWAYSTVAGEKKAIVSLYQHLLLAFTKEFPHLFPDFDG